MTPAEIEPATLRFVAQHLYRPKNADLLLCSDLIQATTKSTEDIYFATIHDRFSFSLLFNLLEPELFFFNFSTPCI